MNLAKKTLVHDGKTYSATLWYTKNRGVSANERG